MSKRDDDSQPDMEVGMTTAERRRRRRRGGGLRVPSDNVPRRTTTPPVVAPVPEDPSLAMSIAYSFTESPDAIPRATRDTPVPSFENHEAMPTVIDPVSGPVEQVDFEMQTREMSAVDLEALGLSEAGGSSHTIPVQRISSPAIEPIAAAPDESPGATLRFLPRDATDPVDDVDVEIDSGTDSVVDAGATFDQDPGAELAEMAEMAELDDSGEPEEDATSELAEVDSAELSALEAAARSLLPESSPARPLASEASQPRLPVASAAAVPPATSPSAGYKPARAQTVALSEDDLEEVREAARLATQPPVRTGATSTPPPMPAAKSVEAKPNPAEPSSVPEIDIMALEDRAAESSGEFEVDVEGIVESKSDPIAPFPVAAAPTEQRTWQASPLPAHGHPQASSSSVRESQSMPAVRDPGHGAPPPQHGTPQPHGASQPQHASPPPTPVAHKAPPSPPPVKKDKAPAPAPAPAVATPIPTATPPVTSDGKPARGKPWFVDLFDEDYLRTLPFLTPQATQAEAEFVINTMGLSPGAQVLDIGCGYGRHAMELAARGFHVVGLDISKPLLVRGDEEAHRRGLTINFVRGDMRELDFDAQFDGAYCLFSTFGYFDDEANKKTVSNIARALKPGGRVLIEILNRDYVIADLPTRVWWEGDGCVVLEEVELNYFSSRIQVSRSVVFDDGRQLEQEISVRAYSLHEVGKLLHAAGLRVLEVSGAYHTRGRFFGNQSRHIIVLAERKDPNAT